MKKLLLIAVSAAAALLVAAIVPAFRSPGATETGPVANDLPLSVIRSLQHDSHAITDSVVTITNDPTDLKKYTRTLVTREITLTKAQPSDSFLGATLVEVAPDGTTTLQASKTQRTLKARVGEYFASPEYGRAGLRLVSASGERQEVLLERTWCE